MRRGRPREPDSEIDALDTWPRARREAVLARYDAPEFAEVSTAWPSVWPDTPAGQRMFYRDLAGVRGKARKQGGSEKSTQGA